MQKLAFVLMIAVAGRAADIHPSWAFLVPDKDQPKVEESNEPRHIPGSTKAYTPAQIDDLSNPPEWFPDEHGPLPAIVQHGKGAALACGACHLYSGHGHPESADITGLPLDYIIRTMNDFKSGARIDPARMNGIAKAMSDQEIKESSEWAASLKLSPWVKVVESNSVPKNYVSIKGRMRLPVPGGGMEPLGNRIIELPQDAFRATSRDPHSGFMAYVPVGSVAKGEALVKTGGGGKTIACGVCHGDALQGLADVPRLAGLHPVYVVRQLCNFQSGTSNGASAALMKKVVANLSEDDMIAIAAYAAAQGQ